MHPEQIKAEIRMRGTTPAQIADELAVSKSAVSMIIAGKGKSDRIATHISKLIGVPVASLWPEKKISLQRNFRTLEKAPQRNTAQLKAELQQLNQRRTSGRKAMAV
jgi:lambda repressor-like predicted transcriptional regulator